MKTSRILINGLTIAFLSLAGIACADETTKEGYLLDSRGDVVKNSYNQCWHTGYWTPAMAIAECDSDLIKKVAPVIAKTEPAVPVVSPKRAAFVPVTLRTSTQLGFDQSAVRAEDKTKLDNEVVGKMKDVQQTDVVMVTGHTDRIGTDTYNQQLSQRRADAVKAYLVSQGVADKRIETAAKGESEPVVSCDNVKGRVSGTNTKLVECLQPNRRVVVEIGVQKPAQQ